MSRYVLLLILLVFIGSMHHFQKWESEMVGAGDPWGYYLYLPATFIYQDLGTLEKSVKAIETYRKIRKGVLGTVDNPLNISEAQHVGEGRQVAKYTMGMAMLCAPFFAIGHTAAHLLGYPTDGYSVVYRYCMYWSALFYVFIGLVFLRRVLLRYVQEPIVAFVLLILALGTNLFFFTVYKVPMSHAYLFALYSLVLYSTIQWLTTNKWKYAVGVGVFAGLITLIRPVELIGLLIPICWGIYSKETLQWRLQHLKTHWKGYLLSVACFITVGIPQLIYWKWASGHWLFYSYPGETFDFSNPHILGGMFGFKNGWLSYTPVICLALVGIGGIWWSLMTNKKNSGGNAVSSLYPNAEGKGTPYDFLLACVLYLPMHIYIIYSWWCWNYINGFGSRPMVETYALLALPLACCLAWVFRRKLLAYLVGGFAMACIALNLFQSWQFSEGILFSEDANAAFVWRTMGKTQLDVLDLATFDTEELQPDPDDLVFDRLLYAGNFEDTSEVDKTTKYVQEGTYSFKLTKKRTYSPGFEKTLGELGVAGGDWLRFSVWCLRDHGYNDIYYMSKLVAELHLKFYPSKWCGVRLDNRPGNKEPCSLRGGRDGVWEEVYFFIKVPMTARKKDRVKTYAWNPNGQPIYLDQLRLELWKKK